MFSLLQSERCVLAKELRKARLAATEEQPSQPVAKKQAIARQETPPSRFSWSSPDGAQASAQRHDELVAGQSSRRPRHSCARRFHKPHGVGQTDAGRSESIDGDDHSPGILCGKRGGDVNVQGLVENVAHWRGALSVSSRFSSGAIAEIALKKPPFRRSGQTSRRE